MDQDLTQLTDEELAAKVAEVNEKEAEVHASIKARKRALADEIERRASEVRIAALADSLTDEDKAALRQHLGL